LTFRREGEKKRLTFFWCIPISWGEHDGEGSRQ